MSELEHYLTQFVSENNSRVLSYIDRVLWDRVCHLESHEFVKPLINNPQYQYNCSAVIGILEGHLGQWMFRRILAADVIHGDAMEILNLPFDAVKFMMISGHPTAALCFEFMKMRESILKGEMK